LLLSSQDHSTKNPVNLKKKMLRRGGSNPRRNALEYGILVGLTTSMACAYGVMIYIFSTPGKDGQPRQLGKVDLNAPINFGEMWKELTHGNGLSGLLGDKSSNPIPNFQTSNKNNSRDDSNK